MSDRKSQQARARRRHYEANRPRYLKQAADRTARLRKKNREHIIAVKESTPCSDCGQLYPHYVMDFDHVSDDKFLNVSKMLNYSHETVKAEIAKCEVVCANCHRIRTYERGQWNAGGERLHVEDEPEHVSGRLF